MASLQLVWLRARVCERESARGGASRGEARGNRLPDASVFPHSAWIFFYFLIFDLSTEFRGRVGAERVWGLGNFTASRRLLWGNGYALAF